MRRSVRARGKLKQIITKYIRERPKVESSMIGSWMFFVVVAVVYIRIGQEWKRNGSRFGVWCWWSVGRGERFIAHAIFNEHDLILKRILKKKTKRKRTKLIKKDSSFANPSTHTSSVKNSFRIYSLILFSWKMNVFWITN